MTQNVRAPRLPLTGRLLCRLLQPPKLGLTQARTLPPPVIKGEGAPGANEKKEPGGSWAGCDNFFPGGVPKLCCPAREPAVPCGYLH